MKKIVKKQRISEKGLEVIIAVLLSITALLTAWTTWIGELHGSSESANYAASNNLQTQGTAMWNDATQDLLSDMVLWNEINTLQINYIYYDDDDSNKQLTAYQLYFKCSNNLSEALAKKIGWDTEKAASYEDPTDYIKYWMNEIDSATESPFTDDDFCNSYYADAQVILTEADQRLAAGNEDNANADKYNLTSVFFGIVMFLLGIAGTFKHMANRKVVVLISMIIMIIGFVYALWVPLPRDFNILSYFQK